MNYDDALVIAEEVVGALEPVSERIQIVGSIRRKRAIIRDIDVLLVPGKDLNAFDGALTDLFGLLSANGEKIKRGEYKGMQVDVYLANERTWGTLLLIRTGSPFHNIRLTSIAKSKKWKLHADGQGLLDEKQKLIASDEHGIFEALGVPYLEPENRDPENYLGAWNTLKGATPPRHD